MTILIDETHDATALSWVESANLETSDFPLQNLPFGIFASDTDSSPRVGVRIGAFVLDMRSVLAAGLIVVDPVVARALQSDTLNALMSTGQQSSGNLRRELFNLLHMRTGMSSQHATTVCLIPASEVTMLLPANVGDFTDFFTSIHHAQRSGQLARPDSPLHPNFKNIPIAYHGRSSSVTVSGVPCSRPYGQTGPDSGYRLTEKLDFELEVGFFVGTGTKPAERVALDSADTHIFGFCLVNDWSARDIQRWEAAPLGPFLAKSFMTSVSPWVVTSEALAPFRLPANARGDDAPTLAAELTSAKHTASAAINISLQVTLQTAQMRAQGISGESVARPNFKDQYWSAAQMLTHHSSNGCRLRPGDLLSSGTVSGPDRADSGCLLERTVDGREPVTLPTREQRGYLEDGDIVSMSGRCMRRGFRTIGFGECQAEVVRASSSSQA